MAKARLRHIAMSVRDPWKTAEFYKQAFGMTEAGETDGSLAEGVFLTDGVINLALLAFESDEAAQGLGKDYVGLHHIGFWVDDPHKAQADFEAAGGTWLMGEAPVRGGGFYEIKMNDPNGVIVDLSHHGWGGAQSNPGEADNATVPPGERVERFAARRDAARAEMAARVKEPVDADD